MIHFYTPPYPLSTYVDRMWLYDGYISPYAQERALPTGTATLVISFEKQTAIWLAPTPDRSQLKRPD